MIRAIKNVDILDETADALIYSTNVLLNCSGGVGAGLVARYGTIVQTDLHQFLSERGTKFVERGEIFEHVSQGMPYQQVFHTIPSNGWYETTPEIIESIIFECLTQSIQREDIHKVVMSVLATGYGHLPYDDFFRIANKVLNKNLFASIDEIIITIFDPYAFELAAEQIKDESLNLTIIPTTSSVTSPTDP